MITLYLAEDQSMLNSALTQLLDLEDDLHVLGSAGDGAKAWQDIQQLKRSGYRDAQVNRTGRCR